MREKYISVLNDFSKTPGARYRHDGEFSGELFRQNFLVPFLNEFDKITINLDGVNGYASCFLEEAFGGLVKKGYISKQNAINKFEFISKEEPELITEIIKYMS